MFTLRDNFNPLNTNVNTHTSKLTQREAPVRGLFSSLSLFTFIYSYLCKLILFVLVMSRLTLLCSEKLLCLHYLKLHVQVSIACAHICIVQAAKALMRLHRRACSCKSKLGVNVFRQPFVFGKYLIEYFANSEHPA